MKTVVSVNDSVYCKNLAICMKSTVSIVQYFTIHMKVLLLHMKALL